MEIRSNKILTSNIQILYKFKTILKIFYGPFTPLYYFSSSSGQVVSRPWFLRLVRKMSKMDIQNPHVSKKGLWGLKNSDVSTLDQSRCWYLLVSQMGPTKWLKVNPSRSSDYIEKPCTKCNTEDKRKANLIKHLNSKVAKDILSKILDKGMFNKVKSAPRHMKSRINYLNIEGYETQ